MGSMASKLSTNRLIVVSNVNKTNIPKVLLIASSKTPDDSTPPNKSLSKPEKLPKQSEHTDKINKDAVGKSLNVIQKKKKPKLSLKPRPLPKTPGLFGNIVGSTIGTAIGHTIGTKIGKMLENKNENSSTNIDSEVKSANKTDYEIRSEETINQEHEEPSERDENPSTEQDSMNDYDDENDIPPNRTNYEIRNEEPINQEHENDNDDENDIPPDDS